MHDNGDIRIHWGWLAVVALALALPAIPGLAAWSELNAPWLHAAFYGDSGLQPVRAVINFWVQIIVMIVLAVISYALAPKPPKPKPPSLEDFSAPTAEEGRSIPVVFGTVWIRDPNVIWYGDLRTEPVRK